MTTPSSAPSPDEATGPVTRISLGLSPAGDQAPPLRSGTPARPATAQLRSGDTPTFYEQVGGHETFVRLVREFYRGVAGDEQLRALYPEEDLGPAEERLRLFLEQFWGGPTTYSETRGHPRLRMRHVPFAVTPDMRDRWLRHMNAAVDTLELDPARDEQMRSYFRRAADMLVNTEG